MKTVRRLWCFIPCAVILVVLLRPVHQDHRRMDGARSTTLGKKDRYYGISLSPNLSSCHSSPSEPIPPSTIFHELNCCPKPYSGKIIDFKFPEPSSLVRIRRPVHLIDKEFLAKYEKAVAMMKQLDDDHPHNFWQQAQTHCAYCNGAYDQANFNGVPFMTHRSWLFFPYHRLFLYFHERILGKLIGDESFALPYWNWDSPDGMVIPSIYMKEPLYDPVRNEIHLPPTVVDISWNDEENGLNPQEQIDSNLAMMYSQMVSGAKIPELFMGCKLRPGDDGACDGPGTVEVAPHNSLHSWVGNGSNPEEEDMGAFYSAARDPIFYAHHCNIDRMWEVWRRIHKNDVSVPEFEELEWLDTEFYFYDENLQLVRVKVRDSLDIDKLKYSFEEAEIPWFNARPKPSVRTQTASEMLRVRADGNISIRGPWRLENAITTRIERPIIRRSADEEEVLVVHGINVKQDSYVKFDVYINAFDDVITSTVSREYVGCYVKNKGELATKRKTTIKFGISEVLEDLGAEKDSSVWVSLVPRGRTGNVTTVDGIRIVYMS